MTRMFHFYQSSDRYVNRMMDGGGDAGSKTIDQLSQNIDTFQEEIKQLENQLKDETDEKKKEALRGQLFLKWTFVIGYSEMIVTKITNSQNQTNQPDVELGQKAAGFLGLKDIGKENLEKYRSSSQPPRTTTVSTTPEVAAAASATSVSNSLITEIINEVKSPGGITEARLNELNDFLKKNPQKADAAFLNAMYQIMLDDHKSANFAAAYNVARVIHQNLKEKSEVFKDPYVLENLNHMVGFLQEPEIANPAKAKVKPFAIAPFRELLEDALSNSPTLSTNVAFQNSKQNLPKNGQKLNFQGMVNIANPQYGPLLPLAAPGGIEAGLGQNSEYGTLKLAPDASGNATADSSQYNQVLKKSAAATAAAAGQSSRPPIVGMYVSASGAADAVSAELGQSYGTAPVGSTSARETPAQPRQLPPTPTSTLKSSAALAAVAASTTSQPRPQYGLSRLVNQPTEPIAPRPPEARAMYSTEGSGPLPSISSPTDADGDSYNIALTTYGSQDTNTEEYLGASNNPYNSINLERARAAATSGSSQYFSASGTMNTPPAPSTPSPAATTTPTINPANTGSAAAAAVALPPLVLDSTYSGASSNDQQRYIARSVLANMGLPQTEIDNLLNKAFATPFNAKSYPALEANRLLKLRELAERIQKTGNGDLTQLNSLVQTEVNTMMTKIGCKVLKDENFIADNYSSVGSIKADGLERANKLLEDSLSGKRTKEWGDKVFDSIVDSISHDQQIHDKYNKLPINRAENYSFSGRMAFFSGVFAGGAAIYTVAALFFPPLMFIGALMLIFAFTSAVLTVVGETVKQVLGIVKSLINLTVNVMKLGLGIVTGILDVIKSPVVFLMNRSRGPNDQIPYFGLTNAAMKGMDSFTKAVLGDPTSYKDQFNDKSQASDRFLSTRNGMTNDLNKLATAKGIAPTPTHSPTPAPTINPPSPTRTPTPTMGIMEAGASGMISAPVSMDSGSLGGSGSLGVSPSQSGSGSGTEQELSTQASSRAVAGTVANFGAGAGAGASVGEGNSSLITTQTTVPENYMTEPRLPAAIRDMGTSSGLSGQYVSSPAGFGQTAAAPVAQGMGGSNIPQNTSILDPNIAAHNYGGIPGKMRKLAASASTGLASAAAQSPVIDSSSPNYAGAEALLAARNAKASDVGGRGGGK